jgi:hypothetical protein
MTMWRPHEPVEEDVSNLAGNDPERKRRRSRRRAWRDGLADQTVVRTLEDVRSYRAFECALMGSIDLRSVIELALFISWQTSCGEFDVSMRSKRGSWRCKANLCSRVPRIRRAGPVNCGHS